MKATEYDVIDAKSRKQLVNRVNAMIRKGWQPQGGVCFLLERALGTRFVQAMVRTEEG